MPTGVKVFGLGNFVYGVLLFVPSLFQGFSLSLLIGGWLALTGIGLLLRKNWSRILFIYSWILPIGIMLHEAPAFLLLMLQLIIPAIYFVLGTVYLNGKEAKAYFAKAH